MRSILQRVSKASVTVDGEIVGEIGAGLLVLVGAEVGDAEAEAEATAEKLAVLRIFEDDDGKMNRSAEDVGAEFLVVSQFTLGASLRKGRRPSFNHAAPPPVAEPLVEHVIAALRRRGFRVAEGRFGAMMEVALVNDGPVTFVLDARDGRVV
ncbi:MAG: D-aminoacyl-tRNA deacylase [Acidobacteriota bacterium]